MWSRVIWLTLTWVHRVATSLPTWKHSGAMRIVIALLPLRGFLLWQLNGSLRSANCISCFSPLLSLSQLDRTSVQSSHFFTKFLLYLAALKLVGKGQSPHTVHGGVLTPIVHQNSWSFFCFCKIILKYLTTYPRPLGWAPVAIGMCILKPLSGWPWYNYGPGSETL